MEPEAGHERTWAATPSFGEPSKLLRRRLSLRRLALFSGIVLLLCFAGIELSQWLFWPAPHPLRRRPGPAVFAFHTDGKILPGISGETRFTTESHGMRYPREIAVPKSAGVYRIFCVGGSTTECTYLDDADAWPARVEVALKLHFPERKIEVINAGFSGLTSADHVEQIEEQLVAMEPDCIVLMAGMNDHIRRHSLVEPGRRTWSKAAMDYSMTVRRLVPAWRAICGAGGGDGSYAMDATGEIYVRLRAECAATAVARDLAAFATEPDPLPYFQSNMTRIADVCRDKGVALVLATHPTVYTEQMAEEVKSLLWMKGILKVDGRQAPIAWHVGEVKRLNDWVRAFAQERKLGLIDVDAALEKSAANFYDDCHLNVAGSRKLGGLAAAKLEAAMAR